MSGPLLPGHGTTLDDLAQRRPDEWMDTVRSAYDALSGRCQSSKTTYRMIQYLTGLHPKMASIRCPVLILHGRSDHQAPAVNPNMIHDDVSSAQKELVWMERSWHVITLDVEREDVFRRVHRFISALA